MSNSKVVLSKVDSDIFAISQNIAPHAPRPQKHDEPALKMATALSHLVQNIFPTKYEEQNHCD